MAAGGSVQMKINQSNVRMSLCKEEVVAELKSGRMDAIKILNTLIIKKEEV